MSRFRCWIVYKRHLLLYLNVQYHRWWWNLYLTFSFTLKVEIKLKTITHTLTNRHTNIQPENPRNTINSPNYRIILLNIPNTEYHKNLNNICPYVNIKFRTAESNLPQMLGQWRYAKQSKSFSKRTEFLIYFIKQQNFWTPRIFPNRGKGCVPNLGSNWASNIWLYNKYK